MEVLGLAVPPVAGPVATIGKFTAVAMVGVKVIVYVAAEFGAAMKPGARTDEDTSGEPLGSVIAVGGALIGRNFVVAIGANRGWSDVDADLSLGFGSGCYETQTGDNR
jgi:hypothetical protein